MTIIALNPNGATFSREHTACQDQTGAWMRPRPGLISINAELQRVTLPAAALCRRCTATQAATNQVHQSASRLVRKTFADQGLEPASDLSPAGLSTFIAQEVTKWKAVVDASGAKLD